jgi:hypothetical protein
MVSKEKPRRRTAAIGEARLRDGASPGRDGPAELRKRVVALRKAAGVAADKKSRRIGGRISPKLVELARRKTGIRSDSDLIEAGLLTLATQDDFGRWLVAQGGRLDKDLDLGL